jgi:peptidoglycan/LPS O-acetylase OafA/YrhL
VGTALEPSREHVGYLDGLRGVAILMVVVIHVSQLVIGLPYPLRNLAFYGVRGVQLFFIVSGFTLTINYRGAKLDLRDFAARRFFRIAPMFYAGVVIYLVLGTTTDLRFAPKGATAEQVATTLLFLHGWLPDANDKIMPGGWSIAAEAMFYLLFPLLLAQARCRLRMTAILVISFLVAGATNLALRHYLPGEPGLVRGFAASFWLCNLPAFAAGCWLANGWGPRISPGIGRIVMAITTMGLLLDSQFRGHSNLLVAIFLLAVFVWAAGCAHPRWLEGRVMRFLGEISFSLYVLHFVIVALLALIAPAIEASIGWAFAFPLLFVLTLGPAVAGSAFTYRYVEKPMIRLGRTIFARPRQNTAMDSPA